MPKGKGYRAVRDIAHDIEIGKLIRAQRMLKVISQTALAAELDVSFQQIQKYEKGTNRVSASRLATIAKVLGVDINFFYQTPGTARAKENNEAADLLGQPHAVRMLRAFVAIKKAAVKVAMVKMVEALG